MALVAFTPEMVRTILRKSEGAAGPVRGYGHTGERHSGITNAGLDARMETTRDGEIALYTAFQDFAQAVDVGVRILNHSANAQRLERLYYAAAGSNDMTLAIRAFDIGDLKQVRIAGRRGTIPTSLFTMILQKDGGYPNCMMVITFFPVLAM